LLATLVARIWYRSLSHSHLHQILRNITCGAHADVPELAGVGGRFCGQRVRLVDRPFPEAATTGLLWEVLSWRIEVSEHDGRSKLAEEALAVAPAKGIP
jgi:hypothetical protein